MARPVGAKKPSAALLNALRKIGDEADATANAAQLEFFDAMEASTAAERQRRISALLQKNPFSADAWGQLAASAPEGSPVALALWRQAVAAGTLGIGALSFLEMEGHFWGFLESRPYMRARAGLAEELWRQGEHAAAIAELQGMLVLNPNDNQGIRYLLMGWLLAAGRDAEAAALHARYAADHYPAMTYGAALLRFRQEGAGGAGAKRALDAALKANPHLAPLLTGAASMPRSLPDAYSPGEASEAQLAYAEMQPAWAATPGALDWLAGALHAAPAPRRRGRAAP